MKKPLRILLVILLTIVLLLLGYFAYVMLSYSRLEDNLPLDVQGEAEKRPQQASLTIYFPTT